MTMENGLKCRITYGGKIATDESPVITLKKDGTMEFSNEFKRYLKVRQYNLLMLDDLIELINSAVVTDGLGRDVIASGVKSQYANAYNRLESTMKHLKSELKRLQRMKRLELDV